MDCYQERSFYYFRHGLYGHAHKICEIGLEKKQSNLILYIYSGIALGLMGDTNEAMKKISRLSLRNDLILVYNVCRFCIYSYSKNPPIDKLEELKNEISNCVDKANSLSTFVSMQVLLYFQAYELTDIIFQKAKPSSSLSTLKAWLDLIGNHPNRALKAFNKIIEETGNNYDLLCMYGKAVCFTSIGQYTEGVQMYNNISSKFDFPEVNIERCRVYILMQKWDFAIQISNEIRGKLFSGFELDVMAAFNSLLKSRSDQITSDILEEVIEGCNKYEQTNWRYQIKLSLALSTLCNHSFVVFDRIIRLATTAFENSNNDSVCNAVLGYHQYLAHNYVASLNTIQNTIENSQSSNNTFAAEIRIRLLTDTGRLLEAQDSIDMYSSILDSGMIMLVLKAKLKRKTECSNETILEKLSTVFAEHLKNFMKSSSITTHFFRLETRFESFIDFFINFRADAIIDALDELITHNYSTAFSLNSNYGLKMIDLYKPLMVIAPNYAPFNFFNALLHKRCNKLNEAFAYFEKLLLSPGAYRLPICLTEVSELFSWKQMDNVAANCIEEASIEDPTLASSIEFLMTKARVSGNIRDSIPIIVPLFRDKKVPFILYIKFIDLCLSVGHYEIAADFIKLASALIVYPSEKGMLVLRQAQIFASRGNMAKALSMIETLKKHKKYMLDAIETESELYLTFSKSPERYIACYYDFIQQDPSAQNYLLLGNAHNRLKQFIPAIDAYKIALEKDPNNEKILTALTLTYASAHRFEDAVALFTLNIAMMRNATTASLTFLRLMIQLKKYNEAEHCISRVMRVSNLMIPTTQSAYMELQGDVCTHNKKYGEAIVNYNNAFRTIESVLIADINNSFIRKLKRSASGILNKVANNYNLLNENDKAIDFYNKSLLFDETNAATVCSLFELFKTRYDIERCRKVCLDYLSLDPHNESIALLLTSTQSSQLNESISCIRSVLDVHPHFIRSLVRLVEMCARAGRLSLARHYLSQAKCSDPGFYFALGLYSQYVGTPEKALKHFHTAFGSNKWSLPAKIAIFGILSNPDRKYIWLEESPLASEESLKECETLLTTIDTDNFTMSILKADLLCARNTIDSVNEAEKIYNNILKENQGNIAASVSSARCKVRHGNFDRAKKLLTFVLSGKPFHENFSYFEEAYLMMAHIVSLETNFTSAQHYIFLSLELNMCCKKGWEMSAGVHMKNKMYNEASSAYGHLWELCDHKDPEVGYSYAFCAMKAKKYDTALIVCRDVLDLSPEYKNLKQEVLIPSFRKVRV